MDIKNIIFDKKLLTFFVALGIAFSPIEGSCNEKVSIFDDNNIRVEQYGANQIDFNRYGSFLIKDPLIWEELQKYFPVSEFRNIDVAEKFYIDYLKMLSDCGCGYAVAVDSIFRAYEGYEEDFYKKFGFPMYVSRDSKTVDFNYELLMLKFFNYYNLDRCHLKNKILNYLIDQEKEKIEELKELTGYGIYPDNYHKMSREEKSKWLDGQFKKKREFDKLYNEWQKKNKNKVNIEELDCALPATKAFGQLKKFLAQYHVSCSIGFSYNVRNINENDIIACENFDLYCIDQYGDTISKEDDVELHYLYVVGKDDNGKIIVSSWGKKYIFDTKGVKYASKIVIKIKR